MTGAMVEYVVREEAPAKLNLALHVTGQREDGFHLLDMLVIFTAFGDSIQCAHADQDAFTTDGPMAEGVPLDKRNIVLKARDYIRSLYPDYTCPPVSITLTKRLPSASGIGGGSADAAATLRALIKLWSLPKERIKLEALAQHIGADVPMCYLSKPLIARGIGEDIQTIDTPLPDLAIVLINCGEEISTPFIFKALTEKKHPPLEALPDPLALAALIEYLRTTRNDLILPAISLCANIERSLGALETAGARFSRMSGSGATCFGIFETHEDAQRAAITIQQQHAEWWVMPTQALNLEGHTDHAH